MRSNTKYRCLGLMSGTSLDGLDLIICHFQLNNSWEFKIKKTSTLTYPNYWREKLSNLHLKDKKTIKKIDKEYGFFIGNSINTFLENEKIDYICSHGHTIFHQPEKRFTLQIGDCKSIAKATQITTINNFRNKDILLNGQGAPLVPIGDLHLFEEYKYCVNIGGFANVSIKDKKNISAYDICPANIILNKLANTFNMLYDKNGEKAKAGKLIPELLEKLNKIPFYKKHTPKSLSREWLEENILPLIKSEYKTKDLLNTFCEHIAIKVGSILKNDKALITGGGVYNKYLIGQIKKYSNSKIIVPNDEIIQFKEALIFAFIGLLRVRNEINCLKSVTGADKDSCCGVIHHI